MTNDDRFEVFFDGVCWCARKRGAPGRVFGDNESEARMRAERWDADSGFRHHRIPRTDEESARTFVVRVARRQDRAA